MEDTNKNLDIKTEIQPIIIPNNNQEDLISNIMLMMKIKMKVLVTKNIKNNNITIN